MREEQNAIRFMAAIEALSLVMVSDEAYVLTIETLVRPFPDPAFADDLHPNHIKRLADPKNRGPVLAVWTNSTPFHDEKRRLGLKHVETPPLTIAALSSSLVKQAVRSRVNGASAPSRSQLEKMRQAMTMRLMRLADAMVAFGLAEVVKLPSVRSIVIRGTPRLHEVATHYCMEVSRVIGVDDDSAYASEGAKP